MAITVLLGPAGTVLIPHNICFKCHPMLCLYEWRVVYNGYRNQPPPPHSLSCLPLEVLWFYPRVTPHPTMVHVVTSGGRSWSVGQTRPYYHSLTTWIQSWAASNAPKTRNPPQLLDRTQHAKKGSCRRPPARHCSWSQELWSINGEIA